VEEEVYWTGSPETLLAVRISDCPFVIEISPGKLIALLACPIVSVEVPLPA
jgi:hypothetical protein